MRIPTLSGPVGGAVGGGGSTYTQALETVDVTITNAQGATITLGYPAAYTTTAASVDGKLAVLPATANLFTFAGIALNNIPNNGVGLVRAYGFCNSVAIFATGTSVTVGAGVVMGPGAASLGVNSTGAVSTFGPVIAMASIGAAVNSPGGYAKGFVRSL